MKFIGDIFYSILYLIVRPFFKSKKIGKKNIKKDDEARVFVANHYEFYGPVIMYFRFNKKKRIWIIHNLLEKDKIVEYMMPAVNDILKKTPNFIKKILVKITKNLLYYIMNRRAKGIPVYQEGDRRIIETMNESVDALNEKYSIVLFGEKEFQTGNKVGNLRTGFASLGKYYFKKTGKKISFYPVFISKTNKTMRIGKSIKYNPEDENIKENIVTYLHDVMEGYAKIDAKIEEERINKKTKKKEPKN